MENEFTIPEVAKILGVEIATVYLYTSRRLLVPDKRIGKNLIFYHSTLMKFKRPRIGWPKGKRRGPRNDRQKS